MAIHLLVTDRDLNIVGDRINCWETIDCTLRHNAVGSGQFTAPAYPWIREQIEASNRVVVIRDGQIFMAGPWEEAIIEQSDNGENSGDGKIRVDFADDLSLIATREAYPNPALTPEAQTIENWLYSGNAELALHTLVNLNAGPGARTERRIPKLAIGAPTSSGSAVSAKAELMEPLLDVARRIAAAGGNLGFRTRQDEDTNQILFEVFAPADLSNSVRFGFGLGNLRYLAYGRKAPTATTAIVGGQGEGTDRAVKTRTDSFAEAKWGRRETLVNRAGSSPTAELDEAGDEALSSGGETVRIQSSTWDTDDQRYGVHYGLGDRVSIAVGPGEEVSDLVRIVHLQAWATAGELLNCMVGTQEASNDPAWVMRMREMDRRLSRIERTTKPATPGV